MSTITTADGAGIYFKNRGSGQPVVFSHGWPLNADAWEDQIVHLGASAHRSSKLVNGATLEVYPGGDHGLAATHKDQLNAELLAFVRA
jgi:pimeloyl-ACP methyl ester carboxylesterase